MEKPTEEQISDAEKIKFMALFMEQYNNQPGPVETVRMPTQTESPQQLVNATPIEAAQHLQPKNDFLTEERGRSVANQFKFYEAVSLLENLESESGDDIGIKLVKAECYIQLGRESKAEKAIQHIEFILKKPPKCDVNDVVELAKDFVGSKNYVRTMILLRIAGDMFVDSDLHPDEIVGGLSRCIREMRKPVKKLLKGDNATSLKSSKGLQGILQSLLPSGVLTQEQVSNLSKPVVSSSKKRVEINERNKVIAFDYGVDVMEDMLDALRHVEGADMDAKVLKQAVLANMINSHYSTTGQHAKALKSLRGGLDLLEKHFKQNANQYQIYVASLLNVSAESHNMENFKEAEKAALRALDAVDHATDFNSEEERMVLIRKVRESLKITRNHVKLS